MAEGYDVAVIGIGMIGSAAVRHLTAAGASVVGLGPGEPDDSATWSGPFASYFDSGRITRRLDAVLEWAVLASRSIEEYPQIEERSGIDFHVPAGLVFVRRDPDGIGKQLAVAESLGIDLVVSTVGADGGSVAHLSFPEGDTVLRESGPAGHIDPRQLVRAQQRCAELDGAAIVRRTVRSVVASTAGWTITVDDGTSVVADRVVVATGPYPNGLLAEPLAIAVRPEAVVLAEVDDAARLELADMPSVIHLLDHPHYDDIYIVPPVRYPDGRWCVKMGGSHSSARPFASDEEKQRWMSGADADEQLPVMRSILEDIVPGIAFRSWSMKPCLISDTASGLPFVGPVDQGVTVAIGGNGHAAKSSDAIGALAAKVALADGDWPDTELSADAFTPRLGHFRPGPGSRHGT